MIIYNVTSKLTHDIAEEWIEWMQQEHIPDVTGTGCFTHAQMLELIETDTTDGPTYAVQYHAESKALYNRYIQEFAEIMRKRAIDKWGNKVISFRSVLKVVN